MLAILNSLNAHYFPIFQLILMKFVSKFMVQRALSDKTDISLGLLSPFTCCKLGNFYAFSFADFFQNLFFSEIFFRNTIRVSNNCDPDQNQDSVSPDLGSKLFAKVLCR